MPQFRCNFCKTNVAQLHITRIEEGNVTTIHACPQCARENDLANPQGTDPSSLFGGLAGEAAQSILEAGDLEEATCPGCGKTYAHFKESGKLGCDGCYETFSEQLVPLLNRIQHSDRHAGKVPRRAGEKIARETNLRALRSELDLAVKGEDFERAARLRDRIRELSGSRRSEEKKP